jgi:hypothetical protein
MRSDVSNGFTTVCVVEAFYEERKEENKGVKKEGRKSARHERGRE